MGRRLPPLKAYALNHPAFALPILVAAAITIAAGLCVSWLRRFSAPKSPAPLSEPLRSPPAAHAQAPAPAPAPTEEMNETPLPTVLPPPPAAVAAAFQAQLRPGSPPKHRYRKGTSFDASAYSLVGGGASGGASSSWRSLSVKIPEGLTRMRTGRRHEKRAEESSIWQKTIMLGERCKVSNDDGGGDGDGDGEEDLRSYHPKMPSSLPVSRTNSFAAGVGNGDRH